MGDLDCALTGKPRPADVPTESRPTCGKAFKAHASNWSPARPLCFHLNEEIPSLSRWSAAETSGAAVATVVRYWECG